MTNGKHKLIEYYNLKPTESELFDIEKDPNEMISVHGKAEYAEIQKELEVELKRLREQYQVPAQDPPSQRERRMKEKEKNKNKGKGKGQPKAAEKKKAA